MRARRLPAAAATLVAAAFVGCGSVAQPEVRELPAGASERYAEARAEIARFCELDRGGRRPNDYTRVNEALNETIRITRRYPGAAGGGGPTLHVSLERLAQRIAGCDTKSASRLEVAVETIEGPA